MTTLPGAHRQSGSEKQTLLILSDGKPGHLNQALAFADLLGLKPEVRRVVFAIPGAKALSYLFDRFGLLKPALFRIEGEVPEGICAVAGAGSATYYAAKVTARRLGVAAVALMLPRGYRYDFDLIVAQNHDRPPQRQNLLPLPINLCRPRPQGLVTAMPGRHSVALVIGGPSRHFRMEAAVLRVQLEQIFALFPEARLLVTTSRRTPAEIEALLEEFPFSYRIIYSREPVNPIADFLAIADYVFVTEDSTSMISEAVSFGRSHVEILSLGQKRQNTKVQRMLGDLEQKGCLHRFDGSLGDSSVKLDLQQLLTDALPDSCLK